MQFLAQNMVKIYNSLNLKNYTCGSVVDIGEWGLVEKG